jgi:hypothetical protein
LTLTKYDPTSVVQWAAVRTICGAIRVPVHLNSAFLESLFSEVHIETTYGASLAGSGTSEPNVTAEAGIDTFGIAIATLISRLSNARLLLIWFMNPPMWATLSIY